MDFTPAFHSISVPKIVTFVCLFLRFSQQILWICEYQYPSRLGNTRSRCCRWRGSSPCLRAWWWWLSRWSGWGRCRPPSTWAGWTPWPGASRPPSSSGETRSQSSPSTPSHLHQPSTLHQYCVHYINNIEYIYDLHNYMINIICNSAVFYRNFTTCLTHCCRVVAVVEGKSMTACVADGC